MENYEMVGKISNLKRKRAHGFLLKSRRHIIIKRIRKGRKNLSV